MAVDWRAPNGETVRLQWDPDHLPNGDSHPYRRAVQLGLKGIERFLNGQDLLRIEDVTPFVLEQGKIAEDSKRWGELLVARERVFVPRRVRAADLAQLARGPFQIRILEFTLVCAART